MKKTEEEDQKPRFIISSMGIPLTQAMEKEFLRMSWARAMVSGRSQFIALQSQNLQDEAKRERRSRG